MRIHLCDAIACVDTAQGRHEIAPQQALLLRLLLLWPNERVSQDLACHVLSIQRSGIGTYVGKLRNELQDDFAVKSDKGFLSLTWARQDTDAATFRDLVRQASQLADDCGFDALDADAAATIEPILGQAFAIWHGSPATGLDAAVQRRPEAGRAQHPQRLKEELAVLDSVFGEWLDVWTDARLLRSDCWLAEGRGREPAKLAIGDLMSLARTQDPPDEIWNKLFVATIRAQDRRRQRQTWELCQRAYARNREDIPAGLMQYAPSPDNTVSTSAATVTAGPLSGAKSYAVASGATTLDPVALHPVPPLVPTVLEDVTVSGPDPRLPLIDLLGITSASALKLRGSRLEPSDCIERTTRVLYFSGVLAGKWVTDDDVRFSLEAMLTRLDTQEEPGDVRFMVIDPASAAYRRLTQMRGGGTSVEPVNRLIRLARRFQCLEVRGISHLPAFRLIVIDDDIVSFSPYALAAEAYETSRVGWSAPHVMLDPLAPWPLASAFRLHYEEEWQAARPLEEEF